MNTFARCVCRLFLASAVSDMRFVKAMLTLLNWFHMSLDVVFSRISISSLSLWEAARSLWESRMLSSVNLDHESGRESLTGGENNLIFGGYIHCPCKWQYQVSGLIHYFAPDFSILTALNKFTWHFAKTITMTLQARVLFPSADNQTNFERLFCDWQFSPVLSVGLSKCVSSSLMRWKEQLIIDHIKLYTHEGSSLSMPL